MIVYEVNLDVEDAIADVYRAWLHAHVAEMLALPGFESAEIFAVADAPPGRLQFCVHYRLRDDDALQAYLRDHAPRMRADGLARFGDRFRASRRILAPLR